MFETIFAFLQANVLPLGFFGVFIASIAEEVIAPIPSALVMMTAGFLFVSGPIDLHNIWRLVYYVGLPAGLGVAIGSLWIYGVAYWGGKTFLEKWGRYIGLHWADVEKMKSKLEEKKSDELAIISARILPVVPSVAISAFCGFMRMRFWKYITLTFIGMFLRGLVMGAIGWQVGNVYVRYAEFFAHFEDKVLALIVVLAVACFGALILRKYKNGVQTDDRS
jgi:membrane protein DedA with SNARE-associated domain